MWDLASGEEITTFSGHAATALITGIAFSPDGKTVFTGADDKFAYPWDAATGQESRAFSGEGLATAGADGSIRTYTLQPDQLTALARARLTRTLTDEECRKFLHAETCPWQAMDKEASKLGCAQRGSAYCLS